MLIKPKLRPEAEAEAARIRSIKIRVPSDTAPFPSGAVAFAALCRLEAADVIPPAAVFLTRTCVADGRGRPVEDLLIPVAVRAGGLPALRNNRALRSHAQNILDTCHHAVRAVVLAEVARRVSALASTYGRGLERARVREARLADIAADSADELVQGGLFDRRALQGRDRSLRVHAAMAGQHRERRECLDAAASLLVAQQSEIVLLLLIGQTLEPGW